MKRLVICFDGTWNRIDAEYPTNVLFTAESVIPIAPDGIAQVIYYDEGVGTARGEWLRGGAFGAGLEKNLNDAYRFLVFNHTPGDEIYLFGFSRGAFTARSFAGLIARCGILSRGRIHLVNSMMDRYFARDDNDSFELEMRPFRAENCSDVCMSQEEDEWRAATIPGYRSRPLLSIRYVGVWDTVGSRGIPKYILGSSLANNRTPKPGFNPVGWFFDKLPKRDRKNGPSQLFQLSPSARRRWHINAPSLPERRQYRPKTLDLASAMLGTLNPAGLGLGNVRPSGKFDLHRVGPDETLPSIASRYYGGPPPGPDIQAANRYKLDDPPQLLVGQLLRVPLMPAAIAWPAVALQPAPAAKPALAVPPEAAAPPAAPIE